jgi:hypothetical protein
MPSWRIVSGAVLGAVLCCLHVQHMRSNGCVGMGSSSSGLLQRAIEQVLAEQLSIVF